MKKLLMTAALLAVGATAFGATAPVNVSLSVVETSQLVIMDQGKQLTQIDLTHPQILLSSAKVANTSSIVSQNFKVQTGDGSTIKVENKDATSLDYTLEGVPVATGVLTLVGANGEKLSSTLKLAVDTETFTSASEGLQNAITSTILPNDLNNIKAAGTYTGTATLKVVAKPGTGAGTVTAK